uniref:Uncharacterized protein n=1 Tax=Anguilla anguilla TaxID=7936 RepID=A0A0E9XAH2_ANGAN
MLCSARHPTGSLTKNNEQWKTTEQNWATLTYYVSNDAQTPQFDHVLFYVTQPPIFSCSGPDFLATEYRIILNLCLVAVVRDHEMHFCKSLWIKASAK